MKQLLLQTIACCAVLLPFSQAEAKTYGGFKPGDKFTFTVNYRLSNKTVNGVTKKNVPVPDGMPDFKRGKEVTFTIGPNGQLTAKGMSLPFKKLDTSTGRKRVIFEAPPKKNYPFGDNATVDLKPNGKPVGLSIAYTKITKSGGVTTDQRVFYSLD
jgi:hypothetical protein